MRDLVTLMRIEWSNFEVSWVICQWSDYLIRTIFLKNSFNFLTFHLQFFQLIHRSNLSFIFLWHLKFHSWRKMVTNSMKINFRFCLLIDYLCLKYQESKWCSVSKYKWISQAFDQDLSEYYTILFWSSEVRSI